MEIAALQRICQLASFMVFLLRADFRTQKDRAASIVEAVKFAKFNDFPRNPFRPMGDSVTV
jgi:hypothetical protein